RAMTQPALPPGWPRCGSAARWKRRARISGSEPAGCVACVVDFVPAAAYNAAITGSFGGSPNARLARCSGHDEWAPVFGKDHGQTKSVNRGDDIMAGHSQFKNIMHRKGRQDAVRSKLFGKLAREITVAAKLGLPDPDM